MQKKSPVDEKERIIVGLRLKKIREYLNINQGVLADLLGTSSTMYQNYESGRNLLSTDAMIKLSKMIPTNINPKGFNVNTHWLLTGDGAMHIINRPEGCFDSGLLADLIEQFEKILLKNNWTMSPFDKGKVITRLFTNFSKRGTIDLEEISWMAENLRTKSNKLSD